MRDGRGGGEILPEKKNKTKADKIGETQTQHVIRNTERKITGGSVVSACSGTALSGVMGLAKEFREMYGMELCD